MRVRSLASISGLRIQHGLKLWHRLQMQLWDPVKLWGRPAVTAPTPPLDGDFPYTKKGKIKKNGPSTRLCWLCPLCRLVAPGDRECFASHPAQHPAQRLAASNARLAVLIAPSNLANSDDFCPCLFVLSLSIW